MQTTPIGTKAPRRSSSLKPPRSRRSSMARSDTAMSSCSSAEARSARACRRSTRSPPRSRHCRSASTLRFSRTRASAASLPAHASATSRRKRSQADQSAACATATGSRSLSIATRCMARSISLAKATSDSAQTKGQRRLAGRDRAPTSHHIPLCPTTHASGPRSCRPVEACGADASTTPTRSSINSHAAQVQQRNQR